MSKCKKYRYFYKAKFYPSCREVTGILTIDNPKKLKRELVQHMRAKVENEGREFDGYSLKDVKLIDTYYE